ncbi:hypothetical protein SISSUDRAFT_1050896 [Sistotremastrum suecicum HHB10207 ss-3]|uniref:Uncharacterized protein n=1 Tax=Sistotremastrum suecicum HHB10207 ss-3 TaxID=1314776 RepID=A0A166AXL0_9AGAM|nr:hypothetical protein SISSUDRAFT_1050896 [Sistotremastrum suecicum HHB10207 ss-3]
MIAGLMFSTAGAFIRALQLSPIPHSPTVHRDAPRALIIRRTRRPVAAPQFNQVGFHAHVTCPTLLFVFGLVLSARGLVLLKMGPEYSTSTSLLGAMLTICLVVKVIGAARKMTQLLRDDYHVIAVGLDH